MTRAVHLRSPCLCFIIVHGGLQKSPVLFIRRSVIGQPQDIIHACVVMLSKLYQHLGGYVEVAALVVAVHSLTAPEYFGKLPLLEVAVLAEVSYPSVMCRHLVITLFIIRIF